jgi:UDP-glucose 4-epimerase
VVLQVRVRVRSRKVKKLIVTGGAGFIGSHVVDALIENGHQVWIVDNLTTGTRENVNSKAELLVRDITDEHIQDELACLEADAIIHMAAQASVATSTKRALFDAEANIMGSINLLEAAKKGKINQVIYTSSAAIYGNPQYLPIDEQHPVAPLSNYGISKYVPEVS